MPAVGVVGLVGGGVGEREVVGKVAGQPAGNCGTGKEQHQPGQCHHELAAHDEMGKRIMVGPVSFPGAGSASDGDGGVDRHVVGQAQQDAVGQVGAGDA